MIYLFLLFLVSRLYILNFKRNVIGVLVVNYKNKWFTWPSYSNFDINSIETFIL